MKRIVRFSSSTAIAALLVAAPALAQEPAGTAGVLVYDQSYFADAHLNTAMDMIRRLPGFSFDGGNNARGFAGTAGNVLVNGQRPTSKTDSLDNILSRISASEVDRIEIIRGGAPGIDMQGQPVVANIIRKAEQSTHVVADFQDNLFFNGKNVPSFSVEFSTRDGNTTYEGSLQRYGNFDDSLGLGYRDTTNFHTGITVRDYENRRAGGTGGAANGSVTFPLWGGDFKANFTLQDAPFNTELLFTGPTTPTQDVIARNGTQNAEFGTHWQGPLGSFEFEALALERLGRNTTYNRVVLPASDQLFRSTNKTSETIVRGTARYHWTPALTVEGGAEGAYNWLNGTTSFTFNGAPIPLPSPNVTVQEKRGELFGQATWKIDDQFTLEGGIRFEFSTISESGDTQKTRSFTYPKPRLLLSWAPDNDTQVRLRFEKVVGQLDFGNFVATSDLGGNGVSAGNADIRPDQREQYALSFERHFMGKGAVVLTLLHEEITDVVDLVPVTDNLGNVFDAPGNIGYGTNNEINLQVTLPLDWLGITNGLIKSTNIWRSSRVHDALTGRTRVISAQRPTDIELTFTQDIESLNSTWGISYFNGWRERYYRLHELRDRKVPPGLLSVFWQYKPTPDWSISVEFDNLTRFRYDDKHFNFATSRGQGAPDSLEERVVTSWPRFNIEIRKTFNGITL